MKTFLILFFAIGLAACTPKVHSNMVHDDETLGSDGIVISAARVIPPFPGRDVSAGYFELTNHGANDRLVSISSPISPRVEMHTHLNEDGVMKMRKVDDVGLPTGRPIIFEPGGYHVMMFNVTLSDAETDVALTFDFETAPSVTVIADIEGRGTKKADEHKGH